MTTRREACNANSVAIVAKVGCILPQKAYRSLNVVDLRWECVASWREPVLDGGDREAMAHVLDDGIDVCQQWFAQSQVFCARLPRATVHVHDQGWNPTLPTMGKV